MKDGIDLNILMREQREFTEEQHRAFVARIGGRSATQSAAGRLASLPFANWFGFWFLSRFTWYETDEGARGHFEYIAGQSHPDEMRRIRANIRAHYS